jgi:O-antigen/teichoic acid export membrane protein
VVGGGALSAVAEAVIGGSTHDAAAAAQHRARWRRQASMTTVVGIAARVISVSVRLVTIPLALHLLGTEGYGLWLTVGSMLAWIGFVGPGLGYGLVNAVSEAFGQDDWPAIRRHVSTAVVTLGALGAVLLVTAPVLSAWPAIAGLLGVADRVELAAAAARLVAITAVLFAMTFSLEFIAPLCAGLQEGYLTSIAAMGASVGILVGVVVLAFSGGTLVNFALAVGLPPIIANLSLSAWVFLRRYPQLRPSWRLWNGASFAVLLGFGGWMFLTQIGDLAIFQSANILIAHRFGPGEVPRYAVPTALFTNVAALCFMIVQPYWPAMKEASVRHDWEFIRVTMARTLKLRMSIMATAAVLIVIGGPAFIRLWSGDQAIPGRPLLAAMSVYYLLVALSGNYVILLLSLGLVRTKALLTLLVGVCHIGGFFLLSPYLGLSAMPVGGAVGVLADCIIASRRSARFIREHCDG